jgi:hypothetical protein
MGMTQIEFIDIYRGRPRPSGPGQVIGGLFIFDSHAQAVEQVAYSLSCTPEHIYHLIEAGELISHNIQSPGASRCYYRVTRESLLAFLDRRKEGNGRKRGGK